MCDLLGLCFDRKIGVDISLESFQQRGIGNYHGWGLAFYNNLGVQIYKEARSANESDLVTFLRSYKYVKSKIFVAHVRKGKKPSYKNSHPFHQVYNNTDYIFIHNGELKPKPDPGNYSPIGETDSERAFCYLLTWMKKAEIVEWTLENFILLEKKLQELNQLGHFNCIFSDGTFLFCYSDKDQYNCLQYLHRIPPYSTILNDKGENIDLRLKKTANGEDQASGYIITASNIWNQDQPQKISNEDWSDFSGGELIIFKDGKISYRSQDNQENY